MVDLNELHPCLWEIVRSKRQMRRFNIVMGHYRVPVRVERYKKRMTLINPWGKHRIMADRYFSTQRSLIELVEYKG